MLAGADPELQMFSVTCDFPSLRLLPSPPTPSLPSHSTPYPGSCVGEGDKTEGVQDDGAQVLCSLVLMVCQTTRVDFLLTGIVITIMMKVRNNLCLQYTYGL